MADSQKDLENQEDNQRFRDLFEHIAIGLTICDTKGKFMNVNEPFCVLSGYSKAELLNMTFSDITYQDDLSMDLHLLNQTLENKTDHYTLEKRYIRKDKTVIWVNLTVSLIRDKNNDPELFFGTIEDISKRKKTELDLLEARNDWKNIFQAINHPTALLNKDHQIIDVNDAVLQFSGLSKDELIGENCFKIFHGKKANCPPEGCPLCHLLKKGGTQTYEMVMEAFNGTFLVSCTPIFDESGEISSIIHIATDITYLKKIEQDLQESENRYRLLLDTSPVGIAVLSEGEIVFVNDTATRMIGAESSDALTGKSIAEIVHPSTLQTSVARIKRMMAGEQGLYPAENKYVKMDGSLVDVQVYATPVNYKGKASAQAIILDVTDQKKAKDSIHEWERRFSNIMNSVNLVTLTLDTDANITFCNQYLLDLTSYTNEEILGKNWFELFIPNYGNDSLKQGFADGIRNGNILLNYENEIVLKGGKKILISWNNTLLKDTNGTIIGTASIGENITENKAYEFDLKKTQLLLSEMGRVAKIGGWEFDPITNKGSWTEEVAKIHDLPPNDETNIEKGMSFYQGESKTKIENALKDAVQYGVPYELDLELTTGNGNTKWVKTIGNVEKQDSKVTRVYGSFQDVTDLVMAKRELILAKEKAEESDRLKTAFLQNMSHEIRTPLNAIMGFSDLLSSSFDDKERLISFTDIIRRRGGDLLEIINDVLDIAKIESGQLELYSDNYNMGDFFSELEAFFSEYRVRVNKQEVEFKLHFDDSLKQMDVIIDSGKLLQILTNLIGNAFKFTPSGSIEVGCSVKDDHFFSFYVRDTGIGIPEEKQTVIFERFMQVNNDNTRLYGGTGLGLSIVHGLLKMLGGTIWIESEPGKGSIFSFTFPFSLNNEEVQNAHDDINKSDLSGADCTILVVEDDIYNVAYLTEVLAKTNYVVLLTDNGESAVEIATKQKVDLILMDIRLPGISGLEATRLIKKVKPDIKIIAQTAYATTSDNELAINAGCDGYISKPLSKKKLLVLMEELLRKGMN